MQGKCSVGAAAAIISASIQSVALVNRVRAMLARAKRSASTTAVWRADQNKRSPDDWAGSCYLVPLPDPIPPGMSPIARALYARTDQASSDKSCDLVISWTGRATRMETYCQ